jgi:hypothetical protein
MLRFLVTCMVYFHLCLYQALANDGALQSVGPFDSEDAGTEVIATCLLIYLPPKYAPIALANPTMTHPQGVGILGGALSTPATKLPPR